eukprot:2448524-Rhodomonas_salina.1
MVIRQRMCTHWIIDVEQVRTVRKSPSHDVLNLRCWIQKVIANHNIHLEEGAMVDPRLAFFLRTVLQVCNGPTHTLWPHTNHAPQIRVCGCPPVAAAFPEQNPYRPIRWRGCHLNSQLLQPLHPPSVVSPRFLQTLFPAAPNNKSQQTTQCAVQLVIVRWRAQKNKFNG